MSVMHVYWSDGGAVMLIGEHKLRVFGETLRKIFGVENNCVRWLQCGGCISCVCHQMLIG